jgi:hypothetical protein
MPELQDTTEVKMAPRKLYNGLYRTELEIDVTNPSDEPTTRDGDNSTTSDDGLTPEEKTFKKRYGDLRSHTLTLTERVKSLESQLALANKKELQLPSTKEELDVFAKQYPDVVRHIRSLAMTELLQERENIATETGVVKDELEKLKRDKGYTMIMAAHPDFNELNNSEAFHEWAALQPKQIQDWLFETPDPNLCIRALDLYKADTGFKTKRPVGRPRNADTLVDTRSSVEVGDDSGKKIWKASEIGKLTPRQFEKVEAEIEQAREEGRIDMSA